MFLIILFQPGTYAVFASVTFYRRDQTWNEFSLLMTSILMSKYFSWHFSRLSNFHLGQSKTFKSRIKQLLQIGKWANLYARQFWRSLFTKRDVWWFNLYSHSYWLTILVQPMAAQCWRRLGHKIRHFLGKNTIINEHPVCPWAVMRLIDELTTWWNENYLYCLLFLLAIVVH